MKIFLYFCPTSIIPSILCSKSIPTTPPTPPVQLEIIGEHGRATITGDKAKVIIDDTRHTAKADAAAQAQFGIKHYWGVSHTKQIAAFYEAIKKGVTPDLSGEDALVTHKLVWKIYAAVKNK